MARSRPGPAARVRDRLSLLVGPALAREVPDGYQRLGRVLVVRVPPRLWPHRRRLGEVWREETGVATVLARTGGQRGEFREPSVVPLTDGPTVTEVVEYGIRYRFDAAKIMFAAGNRTERQRVARLVRAGEWVCDLFAGIGYFALPVARTGSATRVTAVEKNPLALTFLRENASLNGVGERIVPVLGDNRRVDLPDGSFDRVILGWLPDATPWLGRGLGLLRPAGGTVHLHRIAEVRQSFGEAAEELAVQLRRLGAQLIGPPLVREVKPYGPGRRHVVLDARVASA